MLREWGRLGCIGFGGPPGEDTYPAFQATARDLAARIRFLLHRIQT